MIKRIGNEKIVIAVKNKRRTRRRRDRKPPMSCRCYSYQMANSSYKHARVYPETREKCLEPSLNCVSSNFFFLSTTSSMSTSQLIKCSILSFFFANFSHRFTLFKVNFSGIKMPLLLSRMNDRFFFNFFCI